MMSRFRFINRNNILIIIVGIGVLFSPVFVHAAPTSYYTYNDTVLVVNDTSATSTAIANYFMQARGLGTTWATTHVVHINTPEVESISLATFNTDIRTPIKNFLQTNNIASSTNYLITTKGVPLKIGSIASVDQEMSLVLGKYASGIGAKGWVSNPYYNKKGIFSSTKYGYYIVTRLTGYTIAGIESMIDSSDNAVTTNVGTFVLDTAASKGYSQTGGYSVMNYLMVTAASILQAKGYNVTLDKTNAYLTYQKNVLGYYSWGSNDGHATTTYSIPHNTYVNGSIGDTAVSSSGRSFKIGTTYGQSLIADWIVNGISGMQGYTSEPYVSALSHPDILFDRYTDGYNMADSFGMADPNINWKQVIVGDPKMNIIKHTRFFVISPLNNTIASTTSVTFKWNAMQDYYGVSKYQLYIDGTLIKDNITATSTTATLSAGSHSWYIKAFSNNGITSTSTSSYTYKSNSNGYSTIVYTYLSVINVIPGYAQGHTFYVDNVKGNDNSTGSKTSPWKTITKGANTVQAGDSVIIIKNAGIPYRKTLTPANNGNTTNGNITFRGIDAKNKPEIWGSDDVSQSTVGGWTVYSGGNPNTYQKSVATTPKIVAVGASILSLSKKTEGISVNTLNKGEWSWSSNVLYYRLATGENISSLHIEAGVKNHGIEGSTDKYIAFKNLIVKYANSYGIDLGGYSTVDNSSVYDSDSGIMVNGFNSIVKYSVFAGNTNEAARVNSVGATIHNNLFYGNKTGFYVLVNAKDARINNNISSNNSLYDFQFLVFTPITMVNFKAFNNNWSGSVGSKWQNTYKGTNNQASTSPLFTNIATRNFKLKQFSPDIDTGASTTATTDILGNPIYGTPDIGPYEYQPPYTMGTNNPSVGSSIRVYANDKYRYLTATSTVSTSALTVAPVGGFSSTDYKQYMNITISKWDKTGTYEKTWTEDSQIATTTVHTIGDLKPDTYYVVKVDNSKYTTVKTNSTGQFTFNYGGGYTKHTFNITKEMPTSPASLTSVKISSNTKPNLTWSSSTDSVGISKYQLYIDGSLNRDNIASSTTSVTSAKALNCGSHTWYVIAIDNKGNKTNSNTYTVNVVCGSISPVFFPTKTTQSTRTHIKAVQSTTNKTATQNKPAQAKSTKQTTNLSNIQIQSIISVLKSFGVDTATIAKVQKALQGVPTTNTTPTTSTHTTQTQAATSHTTFIPFKHTLYPGLYSKSVTRLQRLLSKDHSVYPEGLVTGYYGSLTTKAVRRFQRKHNIVYSGSISATGYGMVGPRTRRELNLVGR